MTFDILLRAPSRPFVASGHQLKHRQPKLSRQYESSMINTLHLLLRNPQNGRKHNDRGTQREFSSKPLKHRIVECILVFKR